METDFASNHRESEKDPTLKPNFRYTGFSVPKAASTSAAAKKALEGALKRR